MFATYKLMSSCTNEEYLSRDLDDLVAEYKETVDARKRNKLIATIFCKLYPMMLKLMKKYYTLTPEQKIEHAVYRLVMGLEMHNPKKMKFSSFFYMHFSNHMKTLYTNSLAPCRAAFANIVGNNDEVMRVYSETAIEKENSVKGLLKDINDSTWLSSEEKKYCSCIAVGLKTPQEIQKIMKFDLNKDVKKPLVSNPIISNSLLPNNIKYKEEKQKIEKLKEDDTIKSIKQRIKKIRDSIKKKHAELKLKGIDILKD